MATKIVKDKLFFPGSGKRSNANTSGNFNARRRVFLKRGMLIGTLSGIAGLNMLSSCENEIEEKVTPSEDLMREHGVLNRILLIYDTCRTHLLNKESFDPTILNSAAQIIKNFIEDYHEKLEEDFIFPRFEKANLFLVLVQTLYVQHQAGRVLTSHILEISGKKQLTDVDENKKLIDLLADFNKMYRPHETREDTVLFPALSKIISKNEYYALGEDFEEREHKLFGSDGFESIVDKVSNIEKQLGIYELAQFTPEL